MPHLLEELREAALREIAASTDEGAVEAARVRYLGRNGCLRLGRKDQNARQGRKTDCWKITQ